MFFSSLFAWPGESKATWHQDPIQRSYGMSPRAPARGNLGTHRRGAWASWLSKNFWNDHLCPFCCSFLPSTAFPAPGQKRDQMNPITNILKLHKFRNSLRSWVICTTSLSLQGRVYVNLFFDEKAEAPRRWQISKSSSVDIWGEWGPGSWCFSLPLCFFFYCLVKQDY